MSGWRDVIVFRDVQPVRNEDGVVTHETVDYAPVFFNRHNVSMATRMMGAAEGIKCIAAGEVRTGDYRGQEFALLDGVEYHVDANNRGETTVLRLERRLSNEQPHMRD